MLRNSIMEPLRQLFPKQLLQPGNEARQLRAMSRQRTRFIVKKLLVDVGETAIKKPYPTVCCRDGKNFPSWQKWRARVEMHPANFTEAAISMDVMRQR